MRMSAPTRAALELPALLAVIAELTACDLGRREILDLAPSPDETDLRRRRALFEEVQRLVSLGVLVPFFEEPLGEIFTRLETGRPPVTGLHLVRLAALLRVTTEAVRRVREADPPCPALAEEITDLPDLRDLVRRIDKQLDRRGEVRDDASPELVKLRGRIRKLRDQIYGQLQGYIETHGDNLSEDTVPMRGGRLLVTLQAGAKGRLAGLTHGRSGSGKSFYFEPLEVVETNNNLQQSSEDEGAERQRILRLLVQDARENLSGLLQHAEFLAALDARQAATCYAERSQGRLAELAPPGELTLVDARHPLLLPDLAEMRERALHHPGHRAAVVPLRLRLGGEHSKGRCLVVTGPNAGGKTVALKTTGLLTLSHLCGLPVPAAAGTGIPFLQSVVATVGDDQDLLTDRSTFSGRLLRLKEVWEEAGPGSLVLLDELGSGTDPTEGTALAITLLEALVERGGLALMTTHLVQLAAVAMELPAAACAAMELNPNTGEPTFHLAPGPPGGSEALTLARRLGLPAAWLDAAEARLGSEHRDLRRLLTEVEGLRHELAEERIRVSEEREDAAKLRRRLEVAEAEIREERKTVGKRLKQDLESFRQTTARRLHDEVERLREALESGRRRGLAQEAAQRLFAEAPRFEEETEEAEAPLRLGGAVRHRALGWRGTLEKLDRGRAEVSVQGKRLRCSADELTGVEDGNGARPKAKPRPTRVTVSADQSAPEELNLIGQRVEPALDQLDDYLDRALLSESPAVRVIHGHGSGRLRKAIREHLKNHPAVQGQRPGAPNEGGNGATVVTLRA
jgi:DNA mismatch repair protein MutS2